MSMQALQEFVGRNMVAAGALAALGAALDAKASGTHLEPTIGKRVRELLQAAGGGDLLDDIGPQEAATMRALIRATYLSDAKLLVDQTRTRAWDHVEPEILESVGEIARSLHAQSFARNVVPACEGLGERLRAGGAALLDVGVGVALSAIALARMWPELRIVGIDPWEPSLRLARENIEQAGLGRRIELRRQGVEALEDQSAFEYVWFANHFIPERSAIPGLGRALAALKPGGWVGIATNNEAAPPPVLALARLREARWGGTCWSTAEAETVLRDTGFTEVRALPTPAGGMITMIVGRRQPQSR
jgi:2-polyprenyl-3-methyl-5-hydroxy-6-metoxy-1,4-benzoquinol methylase